MSSPRVSLQQGSQAPTEKEASGYGAGPVAVAGTTEMGTEPMRSKSSKQQRSGGTSSHKHAPQGSTTSCSSDTHHYHEWEAEAGEPDEEMELVALTEQLLTAVYHRQLSSSAAEAVLESCPEVAWLGQCALNAPLPPFWQRCGLVPSSDPDKKGGTPCYAHSQTGEVTEMSPQTERFAKLARFAIHARKSPSEASSATLWVISVRDEALRDAMTMQQGWTGPHSDDASGGEFFHCTATGISCWTNPAAAPAYVAHVADQLLRSQAFPEDAVSPPTKPPSSKQRPEKLQELAYDVRRDFKRHGSNSRDERGQSENDKRRHRDEARGPSNGKHHTSGSSSTEKTHQCQQQRRSPSSGSSNEKARQHHKQRRSPSSGASASSSEKAQHRRPPRSRQSPASLADSDVSSIPSSAAATHKSAHRDRGKKVKEALIFDIFAEENQQDSEEHDSLLSEASYGKSHHHSRARSEASYPEIGAAAAHPLPNSSSNAATALAGAAAAIAAAAVALAGMGPDQSIGSTNSLLAAAEALQVAGTSASQSVISQPRPVAARAAPIPQTQHFAVPRLELHSLAEKEDEEYDHQYEAATGCSHYTMGDATPSPKEIDAARRQVQIPALSLSGLATDAAPYHQPPEPIGVDAKPPRRLASLPAQPAAPPLQSYQGVEVRPMDLAPLHRAAAPLDMAFSQSQSQSQNADSAVAAALLADAAATEGTPVHSAAPSPAHGCAQYYPAVRHGAAGEAAIAAAVAHAATAGTNSSEHRAAVADAVAAGTAAGRAAAAAISDVLYGGSSPPHMDSSVVGPAAPTRPVALAPFPWPAPERPQAAVCGKPDTSASEDRPLQPSRGGA